jgi:osmotically-inducible protein OsmY
MDVREQVIAGLIRTRLSEDRRTGGQPIDVLVTNDEVYLLGHVDSDDQRKAAEKIVEGLVGVHGIVDEVVVRTHKSSSQLPAPL